ncbi:MAG: hypothetical protein HYS06_09060 [Methylocystis sp.]|nr:hypothetical protein [Methylocystis sp.]
MSYDDLTTGAVIRYPFLWAREADAGETEGRKERPAAVGFRIPRPDTGDILLLFPITTKEPAPSRFFAEIPLTEKRRAGLDTVSRLWLILDEFNEDAIGGSFYLEPDPPLGRFSRAFFLPLMRQFIDRRAKLRSVRRHD